MPAMRVFVLALLTTVAAACLSATPAMADETIVLCALTTEPCKAKDAAGEAFAATSKATFDFGAAGTITCSASMVREASGLMPKGLPFTGCSEGCSVKTDNLPYRAELANPSAGNGKIHILDGGGGEPRLTVTCGANVCVYGLGVVEAAFAGGKPATVSVVESMAEQTKSFFCPKTAELKGTYQITFPTSSVYIAKRAIEGPMFCEVNGKLCPQESVVDYAFFSLQPKATFTVAELVGGPIECSEAGFLLHDVENPYLKGPWRYKVGAIGECTHPLYTGCTVGWEAPTYHANLFPFGNGDGEMGVVAGASKEQPALGIECVAKGTPFACVYGTEELWLEFSGGEPGTIHELAELERVSGSAAFCPTSVLVEADYEATFTHGLGPNLYLIET